MINKVSRRDLLKSAALGAAAFGIPQELRSMEADASDAMVDEFLEPPANARPWVYWYFMDGHLTREGMDADLAAMQRAGLGGAIYLEVGIGIEPGPIEFMSEPWQLLLGHAFEEADRLGLEMALAAGPGWCGTGGPWIKPDQSMQHLVASQSVFEGPATVDVALPQPRPRTPFFGLKTLPPDLLKIWSKFYRDEFVLAFPTPAAGASISDLDEKALYTRGSYSSQIPGPFTARPWVRPFLPSDATYNTVSAERCVELNKIVNITSMLSPNGKLTWKVPPGSWTVLRFGCTLTGQTTRPAPKPGLGLESDKFSAAALDAHFDAYIAPLLKKTGAPKHTGRGLVALHFDSWEMSSQNWSPQFREEFHRRRGYDPVLLLPTFAGFVVDSTETSERFLWDIRQTANGLVCENQARRLRERGQQFGLFLELEPYDLNPSADLDLGATADIPMAEFWTKTPSSPPTDFSLAEAASIGHTLGRRIIAAESFTAAMVEKGHQHPASMKAQGDWAFCQGINKFVIHRYQAQPWMDRFPGMTMRTNGGYGVHWERTQTWWDFVSAYHLYLSRCQHILRRGLYVADILYLNPEGAPSVFFPPRSAFRPGLLADRRGYNFDGCAPETLMARASVKDGKIVFPDGMSYRLLVLPRLQTITPRLLHKIVELVKAGATVLGSPPQKSPSLTSYPECDAQTRELAAQLWPPGAATSAQVGMGRIFFDKYSEGLESSNPLSEAKWIWCSESDAASTIAGSFDFVRDFSVEEPENIQTAEVTITADRSYELFLNERFVLSGNAVQRARRVDISSLLRQGVNRLTVRVKANDIKSGQSGLIAALTIDYRNGQMTKLCSDLQWACSSIQNGSRLRTVELGAYNIPPWNLSGLSIEQDDIYPSYAATAAILDEMGVDSDFEADAPLRFIHRRDGTAEVYFVANGESAPQTAICTFRVAGRQPEWWDPLTGERRDLPQFSISSHRTTIPLHIEPLQSGFVVFRKPAAASSSGNRVNFPKFEPLTTITSPWLVDFDPKWGAPQRVVFRDLEDWTSRPEPGIRHYSGKANYSTTFDCDSLSVALRYFISLGKVANIASIKLNSRELGVVWCEPWRIAIPAGILRLKGNALEIVVANLWINRLIADSGLSADQRLTWTTSNPFHPGDTPIESGLLGPVTIQAFDMNSA